MYVHHVPTEAGGKLKRCVFYVPRKLSRQGSLQQRGESQGSDGEAKLFDRPDERTRPERCR